MRPYWLRIRIPAAIALVLLIGASTAVSIWMRSVTRRYTYTNLSRLPTRPVGIVFGAMVFDHDQMGPTLAQRVRAGVALYKAGKVQKLLLTGEVRGTDYDEVGPMTKMTERLGVPASAIITDGDCFRTYDSCYRARTVFHIQSAILVTQDFHMPRAIYLARHVGIDAIGYTAPPPRWTVLIHDEAREPFAELLAPIDMKIRLKLAPP